ncbi:hypothetical protein KIN20_027843 [Parelaphostrongylus tenuis]|uniref:Uncharacterized protein n=1 Tax=Parelaphostrongylus tenuis TaxID=148309 RepID=A0AAD5QZX0_PARTN|nr:hypothetical protein KIN20_027843 [Parelaphostrongylus tenuis]
MCLNRLTNSSPNDAYVMESFGCDCPSSKVSTNSAMQAVRELLMECERTINMHGFSVGPQFVFHITNINEMISMAARNKDENLLFRLACGNNLES